MRAIALAVALAAASIPSAASAQHRGPPQRVGDTGLVLGARLGYGVPFGDLSNDTYAVCDLVTGKLPIWLELGYRFSPQLWGNVYLDIGPGFVDSSFCPGGVSCNAVDWRFGLDLQFHIAPYASPDPWVGVGFGLEWLSTHAYDAQFGSAADYTWSGVELPVLEAGLDFPVTPKASIGPFIMLSLGTFTDFSVHPDGGGTFHDSIGDRAPHGWFEIGIRGNLKL